MRANTGVLSPWPEWCSHCGLPASRTGTILQPTLIPDAMEHFRASGILNHWLRLTQPKLVVELGTGSGITSRYIAKQLAPEAKLITIDIRPVESFNDPKILFIQGDSVQVVWTEPIDFLFVDSSHTYEHTTAEIKCWFPKLTDRAVVAFHDTCEPYRWSQGDRGVKGALEDFLDMMLPVETFFIQTKAPWFITHYHQSKGLLILSKTTSID